jgi:hypothetical protein
MKYITFSLLLILATLLLTAYGSSQRRVAGNSYARETMHDLQKSQSPCNEWLQNLSKLKQDERETLQHDGAIKYPNFMLSKTLVPDCALRGAMSSYFARVLSGRSEGENVDRQFAAKHSVEIIQTLRSIWPTLTDSMALVGDGDFNNEKYNLLADPALKESHLAPLIEDIMKKEGVNGALSFVLFSHPMMKMRVALLRQFKIAESNNDTRQQIYCLALLQRVNERTAAQELKKISTNKSVSAAEKKLVNSMLAKIERGQTLNFRDVEDLEYQD